MLTLERPSLNTTKTILMVDDDTRFVKLVKENLEEEGYRVFCGHDGNTALSLALEIKPDVILMDVNMPCLSGLQAFKQLRAEAETQRIPVIFISEMISQIIYPVVESATRVAHIKKPLDLVDLSSLLKQFFKHHSG
jgi:CheY-like chemotaxis protein